MSTRPAVQDRSVTIDGLRFHYRDWPNDGAPVMLLLHGFRGHSRYWDTVAAAFQPRYRVLVLDQRGRGESDWGKDYSRERQAADVGEFMDALNLSQVVLVGHSMGGMAALAHTFNRPATVERLVLVDQGTEVSPEGMARIRAGMERGSEPIDNPDQVGRAALGLEPTAPDDEVRRLLGGSLAQREDGRWGWRYDPAMNSTPPAPPEDGERRWEMFRQISCPVLIVRGERSDLLSREVADRMVRENPNAQLADVPSAGHMVFTDNPEGFLAAVRPFLE